MTDINNHLQHVQHLQTQIAKAVLAIQDADLLDLILKLLIIEGHK